jgi:hypothetical protein
MMSQSALNIFWRINTSSSRVNFQAREGAEVLVHVAGGVGAHVRPESHHLWCLLAVMLRKGCVQLRKFGWKVTVAFFVIIW